MPGIQRAVRLVAGTVTAAIVVAIAAAPVSGDRHAGTAPGSRSVTLAAAARPPFKKILHQLKLADLRINHAIRVVQRRGKDQFFVIRDGDFSIENAAHLLTDQVYGIAPGPLIDKISCIDTRLNGAVFYEELASLEPDIYSNASLQSLKEAAACASLRRILCSSASSFSIWRSGKMHVM